ncbi:MAG: hypothetical protein JJT75_07125 [Opitutales bacterium]|nr:hypothetical protein [Opitutales bacterium]
MYRFNTTSPRIATPSPFYFVLIFPLPQPHWQRAANRNLITGIDNTFGSTTVSEYTYAHNEIGQRTHQPSLGKFDTVFFE